VGDVLIPANPSARFTRLFAGWVRGMMRRQFAGVRLARGSGDVLARAESHPGPVLVLINHASWWDPLIGLVLAQRFAPGRVLASPIEAAQLEKFGFMRRIGLFGLDPEHPNAMGLFVEHAVSLFRAEPRTLLGLTPQGGFADVREPIRLRPGAAAVAARLDDPLVLVIACELPFWFDRRPELLIRADSCPPPECRSTAGWLRVMASTMQANGDDLAALSISRDQGAFDFLFTGRGASVNPAFDLAARVRGSDLRISPRTDGIGRAAGGSGA